MSRLNLDSAENLAVRMRQDLQISLSEPVNAKTVLRVLGIITLYRPLSDSLYGLSDRKSVV